MDNLYINDKVFKEKLEKKFENVKYKKENNCYKKNVSFQIPLLFLDCIDELIEGRLYNSKSEIMRLALKEWLIKEFKNLKVLRYWK